MSRVAIVGAGASGLCLAGLLAKRDEDVVVFDKNEKVGKKLFITGKGRCNITNLCPPDEFLQNVVRGEKFLRSAIYGFTSSDCVQFFEDLGLKTKLERGNRVFPESDKSSDVIKALERHCRGVKFCLNENVRDVIKEDDGFQVVTTSGKHHFDKVVIATGGKSYSATGSTGDGYAIARKFGHTIEDIVPALCPIKINDKFIKSLQGISLKNVALNVMADGKKFNFFGEMLFTDCGISGPIVLTASSFVNRCKNVKLSLDFKPALSEKQLDARLLREFEQNKNKDLKNVLKNLLPKAVADIFSEAVSLDENKKIHDITKAEREQLICGLKNFNLTYGGLYPLDSGIVTSGGVCLKEVNPKTFESKLQKGLYFLGEVLDIDALTGGFNLQIAWATAQSCARNWE
ncbi:MAG: NAD(P)/FAD-dependent oxidoreductase [Candidatus Caccovivens sp.]